MPPSHGAAVVDLILHSPELTGQWQSELTQMRARIQGLREQLVQALDARQAGRDFSFIARERGMFSFLGLSSAQVQQLRQDFSIYMTDNSRINVAGLSTEKLAYTADAVAAVLLRK
jgi:aspartate aminotransferase